MNGHLTEKRNECLRPGLSVLNEHFGSLTHLVEMIIAIFFIPNIYKMFMPLHVEIYLLHFIEMGQL